MGPRRLGAPGPGRLLEPGLGVRSARPGRLSGDLPPVYPWRASPDVRTKVAHESVAERGHRLFDVDELFRAQRAEPLRAPLRRGKGDVGLPKRSGVEGPTVELERPSGEPRLPRKQRLFPV